MKTNSADRNIRLYKLYLTFREPLLWGPILISALIHLGKMSLSEIYFMESIVLIGAVILQIPTGALADLIGRKKTMLIGSFFFVTSITWLALASSPLDVWSANIMWMFATSLSTGADSAFLYDTLKEVGRESEYKKIEGQAFGNQLLITAVCALLVGLVAGYSLRLPIFLSIPGVLFSASIPLFFKEPPVTKDFTTKEQFSLMKISVLFVANHQEVKWIIGFTTLISVISKVWVFTYNPYFELVKLDLKLYGVMFFVLNLIAWFFSQNAHWVSGKLTEKSISLLMVLLIGLPILFMGTFVSMISVVMIFPQNIVRGFMKPFFGEFINRHLSSDNRATVLSIQSAVTSLVQFLILGAFGWLLVYWGLAFCLQILGISVFILGIRAIFRYNKIFN